MTQEKTGDGSPSNFADIDWSLWPLGSCPGQPITFTSLDLPDTVNQLRKQVWNPPRTSSVSGNVTSTQCVSSTQDLVTSAAPQRAWTPQQLKDIADNVAAF